MFRNRSYTRVGCLSTLILALCAVASPKANGQEEPGAPRVITAAKHDTASQPLRSLQPTVSLAAGFAKKPYRPNPHATVNLAPPKRDPLVQRATQPPTPKTAPSKTAPSPTKKQVQVPIGKTSMGSVPTFRGLVVPSKFAARHLIPMVLLA